MKNVDVYNREHAGQLTPCPNTCLISIWSCILLATMDYKEDDIPLEGWKDCLKLEFDDVTHSHFNYQVTVVPFDSEMAVVVLDFMEKNKESPFVIHCDAGMSRSVAMGAFMKMAYDYTPMLYEIGHDELRNSLVFNFLRKEWMERNLEC